MGRRVCLLILATAMGLLLSAPAMACKKDVSSAIAWMHKLERNADRATGKARDDVRELLDDAAKQLAEAKSDCAKATNFGERGAATIKVSAARATLSAAWAMIPKARKKK